MPFILALLITQSSATPNWLTNFSRRICNRLVQNDPYQFEEYSNFKLTLIYQNYAQQCEQGNYRDPLLKIIGDQLRFNHLYFKELEPDTLALLTKYEKYEGDKTSIFTDTLGL